jgi:hypothetical protein
MTVHDYQVGYPSVTLLNEKAALFHMGIQLDA